MKYYAVAILSLFDNDNKIFLIKAENKVNALKEGLIEFCTNEEDKNSQRQLNKESSNDYEELTDNLFSMELCCSVKEIPSVTN